jgi:hypothetical protein
MSFVEIIGKFILTLLGEIGVPEGNDYPEKIPKVSSILHPFGLWYFKNGLMTIFSKPVMPFMQTVNP